MRRAGILAAALATALPTRAASQNPDGVDLRASVAAETVYVGQQITYTLSVRIPSAVRQRLRRNPEFVPPEPRAMLAYDLPLSRVGDPSAEVEVHTFRRALFVLTPGRYTIGSARLTYALPQSASFFSREDERTLRADAVSFVAIEPPARGRPEGWSGAVGQWRATMRAEPTSTRVGDPFVLVLRLEGTGNATLLPRPPLTVPWADVVPQDERVRLDSTPALFGGAKEFTWLVTPRELGARAIAAMEYPVFNPASRQYELVRAAPISVNVRPGTLVAVPTRAAARGDTVVLGIRETLRGSSMTLLPYRVPLTWLALLAPLPWVLARILPRLRARKQSDSAEAPRSVRAYLEQSLKHRTGIDLGAFTSPGTLAAALRLEGVTLDTARELEELRDACDAQGFSRTRQSGAQATVTATVADSVRARAAAVLAKVDAEARKRVLLLLLTVGLVGGCARITESAEALQAFTDGRTAYTGGDYARAREAFRRSTALAPRDAAAWANLGTAAWSARDTATAVHACQRALRLDPTARDVRDRLARVPAPQHRGAARVWAISPIPVLTLGVTLWFIGWWWAYSQARRRLRTRWPLLAILPAVTLIATGAWLDATLAARNLVVLADPTPLRALPALGADAGAMPITGEIARVIERRGVWLRLELDGQREGWYPAERALRLARD
jgi:tetratricopeptide (TPR) repeat protein